MAQCKNVLILGASRGIGAACSQTFRREKERFEVVDVARTQPSTMQDRFESGNLRDPQFRALLAEKYAPDIVIATYGTHPTGTTSLLDAIDEFAISMIDLYEKFEARGTLQHFVAVSSLSAQTGAIPSVYMSDATFKYVIAKRMVSDFFRQKMLHMSSKSKIILVEPGLVRTDFAGIRARESARLPTDFMTQTNAIVTAPEVIAKSIYDAVTNPDQTSMCLTFFNCSKS